MQVQPNQLKPSYSAAFKKAAPPLTPPPLPEGDRVDLSGSRDVPDGPPPPQKSHAGTWAKVLVGVGLAGAAVGGAFSPILHYAGPPSNVQNVQETHAVRDTAATPLAQEDYTELDFQSARFEVRPTVRSDFSNAPVRIQHQSGVDHKGELTHTYSHDRLVGAKDRVLSESASLPGLQADFQADATANWTSHTRLQPSGHAGRYVSVVVTEGGYTGGAAGNEEAHAATYDVRTGQRVKLDDLIEPSDFEDVVKQVQKSLRQSPNAQFYASSDEEVQSLVNQSFSVDQAKDGKLTLRVLLPNTQGAREGSVAEFSFQLPPIVVQ